MNNMKLSAPWMTYVHELEALFGEDPDIKFMYNEEENIVKLFVADNNKADAIQQILPTEKEFGNVVLKIAVIPGNQLASTESIFKQAFDGNPALESVVSAQLNGGVFTFAVFKKKVVQFYNDQMNDLHGLKSMLYEDIARDVFEAEMNVFYSTSNKD